MWSTPPQVLLGRQVPVAPKIIWSSGIVLDCPPEVNGRIVFLKRPHILITGHREIKLEMCWELPLCCPGYWERRLIRSPLLSCEPRKPGSARKHLTRWNIVAWRLWEQPTSSWLGWRPTLREGKHTWYCKPGQNSKAREVIGSTEEPTAFGLALFFFQGDDTLNCNKHLCESPPTKLDWIPCYLVVLADVSLVSTVIAGPHIQTVLVLRSVCVSPNELKNGQILLFLPGGVSKFPIAAQLFNLTRCEAV